MSRATTHSGPTRAVALAALLLALSRCSSDAPSSLAGAGASASGGTSGYFGVSGMPSSAGSTNGGAGTSSSGTPNSNAGSADSAGNASGSANANGGAANGGSANASGSANANGGAANGGAANGGAANGGAANGGAANGGSANGGSASGAAGNAGQTSASTFTCNLVLGVSPTGQWFDSGFLSLVPAGRWESIWIAHHYTSFWADPTHSAWSQAFDPYPGPAHQCTEGAETPDRVLFVAVNWTYTTANQWEADLTKIVQNLQAKYPPLRRIELMTLTRAPGNVACASGGSSNETIIPAWTDVAIAATAAKYPGLVIAAPKFEVPHCSDFMGNGTAPQYTDGGAQDVAQLIGTYYAARP